MPVTMPSPLLSALPDSHAPLPIFDAVTRRNSIRGILLFILVIAMLPVLVISTWQGVARLQRDRDAEQRQLLGAVTMLGASQANVIAGARGVLGILATLPAVRSRDQARCGPILAEASRRFPAYSNFSLSHPDGSIACASQPRGVGMRLYDPALLERLRRSGFLVTPPVWGLMSQRLVLRAILPLTTATGAFDGVITASIDLGWLRRQLALHDSRGTIAVALVDGAGRPVAQSESLPWQRLPIPIPDDASARANVFRAADSNGTNWTFAVAPLHIAGNEGGGGARNGGESFHLVYAAAQPVRFGSEWWFAAGYFMLPLLALVLAATAIWFAANRAILRWVSHLGELARQLGSSRNPHQWRRLKFANAPSEIRDFAAELLRVSNAIADREHQLHQSVAAQTAIARELHHRVRNNLQVMASFLSLQTASLPAGEIRQALETAQLRVATMAMVNGLLYADAEVTTVSLSTLLDPLADLLSRHSGIDAAVNVDPRLAPRAVDIDRAMPLALWIIEAAVSLFERVDPARKPALFTIGITNEDGVMCIVVTVRGLLPDAPRHSLHRRLVVAIAQQMGGRSRIDTVGSAGAKIVLCLPEDELSVARQCAAAGAAAGIAA